MYQITDIKAFEILDSRGNPTIKVEVYCEEKYAISKVPSGASTGKHEAVELRDMDKNRFNGKGVLKAIKNIDEIIKPVILGMDIFMQKEIDQKMIELDGTENKSNLGANAILGVSLAVARLAAKLKNKWLYEYLSDSYGFKKIQKMPRPMMNIINGGKHADNNLDIQEFMIVPNTDSVKENVRMGSEIFFALKRLLKEKNLNVAVGDEGGFAPNLENNKMAFELINEAVANANYKVGKDLVLGIDVAASEVYENDVYHFHNEELKMNNEKLIDYYQELINEYDLISIEDGLAEDDFEGWKKLNEKLGNKVLNVGDDLLVTNKIRLEKAINEKLCNAILIKPNQIGTLTETMATIKLAQENNFKVIISHRSGETCDTTITDLAVAVGADFIKAGSSSRSERVCKYNRLMRIEAYEGN